MDAERFRTIQKAATERATRGNFPNEAQDFAQYAAMKIAGGRKAKMSQLFTDYLREKFGDVRDDAAKAVQALRYAEQAGYMDVTDMELPADTQGTDLDFFALLGDLEQRDRAILVLRHKWGMDLKEIGEVFGVSEGRVSQELIALHALLKKRLTRGKA